MTLDRWLSPVAQTVNGTAWRPFWKSVASTPPEDCHDTMDVCQNAKLILKLQKRGKLASPEAVWTPTKSFLAEYQRESTWLREA